VRLGPPTAAAYSPEVDAPAYRCGDFQLDAANRRLTRRGEPIALEPKTLAVLLQLVARPGELVTRNELLDSVWGHRYVTPSTLNRVVALARRAFGDDSEEPRYIETVHGAGYRYIGPVEREEPARPDAPLRFAPPQAARLPARTEPLIGRELELALLAQLLDAHRAVTVLGTGGMGKTQCALEWARRHAADFPDGVWFFDLAPLDSGAQWLAALAAALALRAGSAAELLPQVLALLRGRQALLLLDNCDRVAPEVGEAVVELLRGTEELSVLATSQAPLAFIGEHLMRLPPLALPPAPAEGGVPLHEVAAAPAVEMLLARVRAIRPDFALSEANAGNVAEICRRLDGMPLALELAAARFALLSPEQVLQRLADRFRFLNSNLAGRDARHRNLVALLDWSVSLLSAEEQRLLSWFSVFVRGWTMEAAIDLAAPLHCDAERIVELLAGLVDKSLASMDGGFDPPRYHLLETVREYAGERLRAAGEEERARAAHLGCMVRMSRSAREEMLRGNIRRRVAQLIADDGNIRRALEHALASDANRNSAFAILGCLVLYFKARGNYFAAHEWGRTLEAGAPSSIERARALLCHGVAAVHLGEQRQNSPARYLLESIELAREHGDAWTEAYACGYQALWLANSGRPGEAQPFAAATLDIATRLNDPLLLGLAGLARGWVHIAHGDCRAALEAMRAVRELGDDPHQRHFLDMYIALALFRLGDHQGAAAQWREGMRGAAAVGNIRGIAGSIEGCGYIAAKLGQPADAIRLLTVAQRIRERTGVPLFNFWLTHHEQASAALRRALGAAEYAACAAAAEGVREEDAANEARALLQRFSAQDTA
jgi:predicted ATPase/DNA-binding winged helix-turn-helix (wHTH) protein